MSELGKQLLQLAKCQDGTCDHPKMIVGDKDLEVRRKEARRRFIYEKSDKKNSE